MQPDVQLVVEMSVLLMMVKLLTRTALAYIGHGASLSLAAMLGEVGQKRGHVLKIGAVNQVATAWFAAGQPRMHQFFEVE